MSAPVLAHELMLLAAIERAERQVVLPGERKGARRNEVVAHLGLDWHSGNARRLKGQLEALEAEGCVEIQRKIPHRSIVALTRRGHDRLQLARRQKAPEAMAEALPESPQHRRWREARAVAEESEDEIRSLATDAVHDAQTALLKPEAGEEAGRPRDQRPRERRPCSGFDSPQRPPPRGRRMDQP